LLHLVGSSVLPYSMDINSDKYAGITQWQTFGKRMSQCTILLCRRWGICAKQEYNSTFGGSNLSVKKKCTAIACAEHEGMWNVLLEFWAINGELSSDRITSDLTFQLALLRPELFCTILFEIKMVMREDADKSLARPGRKQATATKIGIYSTCSPRSFIHLLAPCSTFCKPLKKKLEVCPSNQVSAAAMTSASDEKWQTFNCFLQSGEQVVVRRGQIWRIGWVIRTSEAQVGQFLLQWKCPVSRGIVVQEQDHPGDLPAPFFLQNVLQLHQQR